MMKRQQHLCEYIGELICSGGAPAEHIRAEWLHAHSAYASSVSMCLARSDMSTDDVVAPLDVSGAVLEQRSRPRERSKPSARITSRSQMPSVLSVAAGDAE
jgi:hypothetical protein